MVAETHMREQDVCLELLLDWLADERGRRVEIERTEEPAPGGLAGGAAGRLPRGGVRRGGEGGGGGGGGGELVRLVREVASALEPGQRADVPVPATIYIKKQHDEGALMSVSGGRDRPWD